MAKTFLRVLCFALVCLLIPPTLFAKAAKHAAKANAAAATSSPSTTADQNTAAQDDSNNAAPVPQAGGTATTSGASMGIEWPGSDRYQPMPGLWGYPGLWRAIGAGGLPHNSFGESGWVDRINRNPGYLKITSIGTSGFYSFHRRVAVDWTVVFNRHIDIYRADQLSLGQQQLVLSGVGGCPEPNCFPTNLYPMYFMLSDHGGFTSHNLLRDPHTGFLTNTAGYYNEYPWATFKKQNGWGEVTLGSHITLKDFGESHWALGIRPHVQIPTHTEVTAIPAAFFIAPGQGAGNNPGAILRAKGLTQLGAWTFGADLLLEAHGGPLGFYANAGYNHLGSPESGGVTLISPYSQIPTVVGINIPRTSRLQLMAEYMATFLVGGGTRDQGLGSVTDGTVGFRLYATPWLALTGGYRHTLNYHQMGGDKNGFVATVAVSYIGGQVPPAPIPPTVTCSADKTTVRPGDSVNFTATASTPTGRPLTYTWTTTGGRLEGNGNTAHLDTTGLAPGSYTVTVRVDDGRGGFADCSTQITVEAPPVAPPPAPPTVTCNVDRSSVNPGETVSLTATGTSRDNRPLNYDWTVTGGRITGTGPSVRWDTTGLTAGSYTATVRVTDDRGLTADCSTTLSIAAPPAAPRAQKLNSCTFKRLSPRVDNVCKAVLDDVALRLQNEAGSRAAVIGSQTARERNKNLSAQRASNVKGYLVQEKGIDAGRIEVRTNPSDTGTVDIWLIPQGASASDVPGAAATEMRPQRRAPARRHRRAAKKAPAGTGQ